MKSIDQKQKLFNKRQSYLNVISNLELILQTEGDVLITNKIGDKVYLKEKTGTKAILLVEMLKTLKNLVIDIEQEIMDIYEIPPQEYNGKY